MPEQTLDLAAWISRVQKAKSAKEVLSTLDEFRKLGWSDDDRARMGKAYVRVLERVGAPQPDETDNQQVVEKDDGPVWYEKM